MTSQHKENVKLSNNGNYFPSLCCITYAVVVIQNILLIKRVHFFNFGHYSNYMIKAQRPKYERHRILRDLRKKVKCRHQRKVLSKVQ
jgi:hypothetical protein